MKPNNRIIVIGDTHGRDKWLKVLEKECGNHIDKFIFIGDYFDSFDVPFEKQMENFNDILRWKKMYPDRIVLLFGNHEFHYISNEQYSGFQIEHSAVIRDVIEDAINNGLIHMCHRERAFEEYGRDILFTHAGITNTWAKKWGVDTFNKPWRDLNAMLKNQQEAFKFQPSSGLDSSGDSITQSPIWVRPRALLSDKFGNEMGEYRQVVGHTHQKGIVSHDGITFIDTFDSCGEYLIIQDGVESIGKI